jgi:hypothetical protein
VAAFDIELFNLRRASIILIPAYFHQHWGLRCLQDAEQESNIAPDMMGRNLKRAISNSLGHLVWKRRKHPTAKSSAIVECELSLPEPEFSCVARRTLYFTGH